MTTTKFTPQKISISNEKACKTKRFGSVRNPIPIANFLYHCERISERKTERLRDGSFE